ncbi:antitoxin VbhA family protein [Janthinobacterium lividum]|nr:antitoxin VbhA family protein [Janthinobacterium lividum]
MEYDESCTIYDEDRRQATLASIGMSADQRRHQDAVDFARSSLFLSGLKVSETCEQEAARFVRGEISIDEFFSLADP